MSQKGKPTGIRLASGEEIRLKDSDFLGEGGEGSVWSWKGCALKIAGDPKVFAMKAEKVRRLSRIRHPSLLTPTEMVLDARGDPVGYAMPLTKGEPLARHFSPAWQDQAGLAQKDLEGICSSMREALLALHSEGAVGGDINEFNWAVEKGRAVLFDSDSWGIGAWPVSAMMPSIADPLANGRYGASSDWFALATLSFQLFAGAHPFRGSHPGFPKGAWKERMAAGASLWDAGAGFPKGARGLSAIPPGLGDWMREILSNQAREPMPEPGAWRRAAQKSVSAGAAPIAIVSGRKAEKLEEVLLPAFAVGWAGDGAVLLANGKVWDMGGKKEIERPDPSAILIRGGDGSAYWVWAAGDRLAARDAEGARAAEMPLGGGSSLRTLGGRVFIFSPGLWREVEIRALGGKLALIPCSQGIAAGRSLGGESGIAGFMSLGGIAWLAPAAKRCGGLSASWAKGVDGEWVWGAKRAHGALALGKRDGNGNSWWEIRTDAGSQWKMESDLRDFEANGGGWVAVGSGTAFVFQEGKDPQEAEWDARWKEPRYWGGALWALKEDRLERIGIR